MDDPSRSASTGSAKVRPFGAEETISTVTLDPYTITSITPDAEHEWRVAIDELVEENSFRPAKSGTEGPFALHLSIMATTSLSTSAPPTVSSRSRRIFCP